MVRMQDRSRIPQPTPDEKPGKNPAAQALGRLGGLKGGNHRAEAATRPRSGPKSLRKPPRLAGKKSKPQHRCVDLATATRLPVPNCTLQGTVSACKFLPPGCYRTTRRETRDPSDTRSETDGRETGTRLRSRPPERDLVARRRIFFRTPSHAWARRAVRAMSFATICLISLHRKRAARTHNDLSNSHSARNSSRNRASGFPNLPGALGPSIFPKLSPQAA